MAISKAKEALIAITLLTMMTGCQKEKVVFCRHEANSHTIIYQLKGVNDHLTYCGAHWLFSLDHRIPERYLKDLDQRYADGDLHYSREGYEIDLYKEYALEGEYSLSATSELLKEAYYYCFEG